MVATLLWGVSTAGRRAAWGQESGHSVAAPVVELEIVTPLWVRDPLTESEERRQCSLFQLQLLILFYSI